MSTNLGTVLVGLGYDLSALEKGAPEAFRLINSQTLGMSAEMKRASREGAESFRLIDESLGIHLSRPLTRLLTQEFPSLAKGLQSILGVGVVGALGLAGVELFDKMAKGIEKAEKAQEALRSASEKTKSVFENAMAGFEKDEKLRSLRGGNLKIFEIDYAGIEQARQKIDQLTEALDKEAKAAAEANGPWTQFLATLGEAVHIMTSLNSTLGVESIGKQLGQFKQHLDNLSRIDALNQTHYSASAIAAELEKADKFLKLMQGMKLTGVDQAVNAIGTVTGYGQLTRIGFSQAEIDAQKTYLDGLSKISQLQAGSDMDTFGKENLYKQKMALEAQREAIKELQGDLKGYNEEANNANKTWEKTNAEIEKAAGVEFFNKGGGASNGPGALADQALKESVARFAEFQKINGSMNLFAPPPGAPQLADQQELEKVTSDQNEAWKKAGEILAQIESPMQKFSTQMAVIKQLEDEGRISTAQFAQAQQLLQEQLAQSENKMEKLLKSGGAAGGLQAFMMQMRGEGTKGSEGQFTFDLLNKGLQGFEDETAKALTGAKTNWMSFFASLEQMALKFFLNKMFTQLLGGIPGLGGLFGGAGAAGAGAVTSAPIVSAIPPGGAFASGTDFAPGGMSLVGENGPEMVNLPTGASVTPNSALRGSLTNHFHIDAKGAEIGVEAKIARALSAAAPQMIMRAVVEASEIQKRTPR